MHQVIHECTGHVDFMWITLCPLLGVPHSITGLDLLLTWVNQNILPPPLTSSLMIYFNLIDYTNSGVFLIYISCSLKIMIIGLLNSNHHFHGHHGSSHFKHITIHRLIYKMSRGSTYWISLQSSNYGMHNIFLTKNHMRCACICHTSFFYSVFHYNF